MGAAMMQHGTPASLAQARPVLPREPHATITVGHAGCVETPKAYGAGGYSN
jgi:hypothetical protein